MKCTITGPAPTFSCSTPQGLPPVIPLRLSLLGFLGTLEEKELTPPLPLGRDSIFARSIESLPIYPDFLPVLFRTYHNLVMSSSVSRLSFLRSRSSSYSLSIPSGSKGRRKKITAATTSPQVLLVTFLLSGTKATASLENDSKKFNRRAELSNLAPSNNPCSQSGIGI